MLYGIVKKGTLIVAAADTLSDFENFGAGKAFERPNEMDMWGDEFLSKLSAPPYIIPLETVELLVEFAAANDISLIGENRLASKSKSMKNSAEADPYAHGVRATIEEDEAAIKAGTKVTIGSIHGIDTEDRWDVRTDEQKAKALQDKEEYDKKKKAGQMSGDDSFAASPSQKSARVTDVRVTVDADGTVEIDNVLAVKGLYDADDAEDEIPDNDDLSIDPEGKIAIYFKVDVKGAKLSEIEPVLLAAAHRIDGLVQRNSSTGCWIAFVRKVDAVKAVETLTAAGFEATEYGVDDHGERLVAEGVEGVSVVDTSAPKNYGPRIWNDRAAEIAAIVGEDDLKKHNRSFKGEEFLFCAEYGRVGMGTVVHIVPKEYFDKHGKMFPENLNIGHVMPDDFKEIEPGVFKTMGRNLHVTVAELAHRRGFIESMRLQLFLNNED